MKFKLKKYSALLLSLMMMLSVSACDLVELDLSESSRQVELSEVNEAYAVVNDNVPSFTDIEITDLAFEEYAKLDYLGRCGTAVACVGVEIMPTEDRTSISSVKPSGWINNDYGELVDGGYLYNRCHLIGFQLTGENANEKNLITGTRYMNVDGMLPFENMIADYVKETENHVMYRVKPDFEGTDLVAKGVYMEAYSVEDEGEGISFNVYCYNVQPGIEINYATGDNCLSGEDLSEEKQEDSSYILNTSSKRIHKTDCSSVDAISNENRAETTKTKEELLAEGYSPCGNCKP